MSTARTGLAARILAETHSMKKSIGTEIIVRHNCAEIYMCVLTNDMYNVKSDGSDNGLASKLHITKKHMLL